MDHRKIAFLSKTIALGGASKSLYYLLKAISRNKPNWELYLFVNSLDNKKLYQDIYEYVASIEVIDIPEYKSAQSQTEIGSRDFLVHNDIDKTNIHKFANKVSDLGIDCLHINQSIFSLIYKIFKEETDVKIITHVREWIHWNGIYRKQRFIIEQISEYSDAIICISPMEVEVFHGRDNLYIIPNPLDFKEIRNNQYSPLNEKDLIIGNMASFTKTRGLIEFAEVIDHIEQNYSELPVNRKYVMLGGIKFNFVDLIKSIIIKFLGKETVFFSVYKNIWKYYLMKRVLVIPKQENVVDYLKSFDIAVRSSSRGDPWGRNIIEYMAVGKPVIATGNSQFMVQDGKTGFLVEPGDKRALAEKIVQLMKNDDQRIIMGKLGYERIYKMCNMDIFSERIMEVYRDVL